MLSKTNSNNKIYIFVNFVLIISIIKWVTSSFFLYNISDFNDFRSGMILFLWKHWSAAHDTDCFHRNTTTKNTFSSQTNNFIKLTTLLRQCFGSDIEQLSYLDSIPDAVFFPFLLFPNSSPLPRTFPSPLDPQVVVATGLLRPLNLGGETRRGPDFPVTEEVPGPTRLTAAVWLTAVIWLTGTFWLTAAVCLWDISHIRRVFPVLGLAHLGEEGVNPVISTSSLTVGFRRDDFSSRLFPWITGDLAQYFIAAVDGFIFFFLCCVLPSGESDGLFSPWPTSKMSSMTLRARAKKIFFSSCDSFLSFIFSNLCRRSGENINK